MLGIEIVCIKAVYSNHHETYFYHGIYQSRDSYVSFKFEPWYRQKKEYPKSDFADYEEFKRIMKPYFREYIWFKYPVEIKDPSYREIESLYKRVVARRFRKRLSKKRL